MSYRNILSTCSGRASGRISAVVGFLAVANLLVWTWAQVAFRHHPALFGTALIAYLFGLRHAVDADHIAAIDNVTRKLMQEGKRPVTIGLFFSLGHSSVVVIASLAVSVMTVALRARFEPFRAVGGLIGTSVSASFLFVIAGANLMILCATYRAFQRRGQDAIQVLTPSAPAGGLLANLFRRLFQLITSSWHMYPLGFLFGLGFDTATEIGLLGVSATTASSGLSIWSIMVFPALFTAGMSLVDTIAGVLVLGAYGWAFADPVRKLHYNMMITLVSVLVAVLVGCVELLGLFAEKLHLPGWLWRSIAALSDHFATLGYLIIAIFLAGWLLSIGFAHSGRATAHRRGVDQILSSET